MKSREVVLVDGIRTAFGRAGEQGFFWDTRADDMVVKVIRELLRRNPQVGPDMVEENVWGATTQEKIRGSPLGGPRPSWQDSLKSALEPRWIACVPGE